MCLLWRADIIALRVAADAAISLSYKFIPIALVILYRQGILGQFFRPYFPLFAAFITLCGMTHDFDIVTTWNPVYWADVAVRMACGAVSLATTAVLWRGVLRQLGRAHGEQRER